MTDLFAFAQLATDTRRELITPNIPRKAQLMITTMSATARTLGTAELLELILRGLDMHTLLHCQRVSRFWSSSVKTSPTLQRKLWLLPDNRELKDLDGDHHDGVPSHINPLIMKYCKRIGIFSIDADLEVFIRRNPDLDENSDPRATFTGDQIGTCDYVHCERARLDPHATGSWQQMIFALARRVIEWDFHAVGISLKGQRISHHSSRIYIMVHAGSVDSRYSMYKGGGCWTKCYMSRDISGIVSGDRPGTMRDMCELSLWELSH